MLYQNKSDKINKYVNEEVNIMRNTFIATVIQTFMEDNKLQKPEWKGPLCAHTIFSKCVHLCCFACLVNPAAHVLQIHICYCKANCTTGITVYRSVFPCILLNSHHTENIWGKNFLIRPVFYVMYQSFYLTSCSWLIFWKSCIPFFACRPSIL
jgi:hypothetical protein